MLNYASVGEFIVVGYALLGFVCNVCLIIRAINKK